MVILHVSLCQFSFENTVVCVFNLFILLNSYVVSAFYQDLSDSIANLDLMRQRTRDHAYREEGVDAERTLKMLNTGVTDSQTPMAEVSLALSCQVYY